MAYFSSTSSYWIPEYLIYALAYILTQWCTLEATRIYIALCIPTMTICNIYLRTLKVIGSSELNIRTLLLYTQLHCINQIGMRVIAKIAGAFMGVGFLLFVIGNWIILKGWNILPVQVYVLIFGIVVIAYFVLVQTIPLAISCNEFCKGIINRWETGLSSPNRHLRYWKRKVRAQQAISFYYALTRFERNTQVNYYSAIVSYTTNALMLF